MKSKATLTRGVSRQGVVRQSGVLTSAGLLLAMTVLAMALGAWPGAVRAALVKADIVAAEGDLVTTDNLAITSLRIPMEDGAGRPVFTGIIDTVTSGSEAFLWHDAGVIWRNSNDPSVALGNLETMGGASTTGQFLVSPSVGGDDAVYSNSGVLLKEDEPAPGVPGKVSSFNSRPRMTSDGTAWWVGGFTTNPGDLTEGRVLYRATDAGDPGTITPIIKSGDVVDGKTINSGSVSIDFNYDISDNSANYIAIITDNTINEAVLFNTNVVAEEGQAAGDGNNWENFDIVGVNNSGDWFITGDTDGAIATDELIVVNGTLQVREGDEVGGVTLTAPATVVAAAINNNCLMAHIWTTGGNDALFVGYANYLGQSQLLMQTGDELDINNDTVADYVVNNIFHNTSSDYGLDLGDNGVVYLRLTLEPAGGGTPFDAVVRLTINLPNPLIVTNTEDAGFGSLRNAIEFANGKCGPDTITFDLPSTSTRVIQPLSPLPPLTDPVVIDASADADGACSPTVELDGSLAGPSHGLLIQSDFCEVRGLIINNWEYAGIWVDANTSNTIQCNYIGTDRAGTAAAPNGQSGIITWGSQKTTIGGTGPGEGNLISGNGLHGIHMNSNTSGTLIMSNLIGTDVTGLAALPNTFVGVRLEFSDFNIIGGLDSSGGNVISGNGGSGMFLLESENNVVGYNYIGVDATGLAGLGNGLIGLLLDSQSSQNQLGYNVISGNATHGLVFSNQSNDNFVFGNIIGLGEDGDTTIPNGQHGVAIYDTADNLIGFNVISGNPGHGVFALNSTGMLIALNRVGTDGSGLVARPNDSGIVLDRCFNNQIGIPAPTAGNLVSGNINHGIWLTNNTSDTLVQGCLVGLDLDMLSILGNGQDGIRVEDSTQNTIGQANIVGGNTGAGIRLLNSDFNDLELNLVGISFDTFDIFPNGQSGISLNNSSDNALRISIVGGSGGHGIEIINNSDRNEVTGAFVGAFFLSPVGFGNTLDGIHVADSIDNVLGGPGMIDGIQAGFNGGDGIELNNADYTFVQGGRIGVDLFGQMAQPNGQHGVAIVNGSQSNDVELSVISGNTGNGVYVADQDTGNNTFSECLIGLNLAGDTAIPNGGNGAYLFGSRHTQLLSSVISGNTAAGVLIVNSDDNEIWGNKIGTDITGTAAIQNTFGVRLSNASQNNKIGGPNPNEGNLISGNNLDGVSLTNALTMMNTIQGNIIGADISGNAPLPNNMGVVFDVEASQNLVGGLGMGEGNKIAYNDFAGVDVGTSSTRISILSNSIFSNGLLGIDLNHNDVPDPNDPLDADEGANLGQNYPVLSHQFAPCEPVSEIDGALHSEADSTYTIQLFWSQECDPSGFGEGAVHFDTFEVMTDALGDAIFTQAVGPFAGGFVTATATSQRGDTSEFSACLGVGDFTPPTIVCPADIEVPGEPGVCEAQVNVPQPVVDDDCTSAGALVVTNDYTNTDDASGVYPGGTTIVTWTVEDQGGNTTQCQQLITVVCVAECTLDPVFATNPIETTHTVILTVTLNGATPVTTGTQVLFQVISGPNAPTSGTAQLDILGQAEFSYFGAGGNGIDTIVASGGGQGFEFQCQAEKEWTGGEPTPTPTPTPTETPTPTPTATPTPEPTPTPCIPNAYDFEGTDDGWTTGGAPLTFDLPAFGQTASALTINPNGFFTFGFWQSPPAAISSALPDHMYAVRFNLAWDQEACLAPTLRLRAISENFQQLEVLGINSTGDCSGAPGAAPRDYVLHFIPQFGGANEDFIVALDQLAFDPFDAPAGTVALEYVDIYCFPLSAFIFNPLVTYNFAGSAEGWTTGSAALLTPPVFESTALGLEMTSTNNVTTFGYWQSPDAPVAGSAGKILAGEFNVLGPAVVVGTAASFRMRMITTDSQGFRYTEFPAVPQLIGAEIAGVGNLPTILYEAPNGAGVNFTWDFINFNLMAAESYNVALTGVVIMEADAPVLP